MRGCITELPGVWATIPTPAELGGCFTLKAEAPLIILGCVCSFISILEVQTSDKFLKLDAGQVVVTEDTRWGWRGEGTEEKGGEGRREEGRSALSLYFQIVGCRSSSRQSSELSPNPAPNFIAKDPKAREGKGFPRQQGMMMSRGILLQLGSVGK